MATQINKVMPYTLFACAGLALCVTILSFYFKRNYIAPDLGRLKRLMAILGAVMRIAWLLLRLAHYVLLALILVLLI